MSVMDVFTAVTQADEAAGCALMDAVVYDWMTDEAQAVAKDLAAVYTLVGLDRIQKAKRQLGRSYVAMLVEGSYPDDDVQKAAEYLVGLEQFVSKAWGWENWNQGGNQQRRQVSRDAQGRFARGISQSSASSVVQAFDSNDPESQHIQPAVRREIGNTDAARANSAENQKTQSQWEQANNVAREYADTFKGNKRDNIMIEMQLMRENGDQKIQRVKLSDAEGGLPDEAGWGKGWSLISMEVAPAANADSKTVSAVASYNLLGETGGAALASLMQTDSARAGKLKEAMGMDYNPSGSKLNRFFGRMEAGGQVLGQVQGGEKLGRMAELVGTLGPQAEEVLGPYAQRAAYRYRGTETSPSKTLRSSFNNMTVIDRVIDEGDNEALMSPQSELEGMVARAAYKGQGGMGLSGDSLKMQARSDIASAELVQTLPKDPILSRLSEASGDVLPSQGVLINADGKIVSQSVGFANDHYLPFDLKNLGSLRGGQYVRTRQAGGLTGEDVYAAVTMGARQVQVVSPSGLFTLEMAPDFRGARANSDKARGMYDRYLKILDAVESSGLYLQDISPAEKQKITRQVADLGYKDNEASDLVARRIDEARRDQTMLTEEDETAARAETMREMGLESEQQIRGATARTFEDTLDDKLEQMRATKANRLRLNGEGYAVALQTLQQQFPYFIKRTEYRALNDFTQAARLGGKAPKGRTYAADTGYTRPMSLKPVSARSGFFEPGGLNVAPKETPRQKERRIAGEKERAAAANAPAAAAAPDGEATDATAAAAAATPAEAKEGVWARADKKGPQLEKNMKTAVDMLANTLGPITLPFNSTNISARPPFSAVSSDPVAAAKWLLSGDSEVIRRTLTNPQEREEAAYALSDTNAVAEAFTTLLFAATGNDYFSAGGKVQGNSTPETAAAWVAEQAQVVADTAIMMEPFVPGNKDPWYGSTPTTKNVVVPQAFDDIKRLENKKQIDDFGNRNKAVWNDAIALMGEGDSYRTMGVAAVLAHQQVNDFAAIDKVQTAARANKINTDDDLRDNLGDEEVLRRAATVASRHDPQIDPANVDGTFEDRLGLAMKIKPKDEALGVQRAWSLGFATRLAEAFESGDAVPKGRARWLNPSVAKAHLVILSKSDPLAREVARRAALGLPFVPVRTGRSLT